MTSGETIIKFTDYPFAYSIVGVGLGMLGFSFSQNQIIFLGIAGAFGTLLATIDPVGWMIRSVESKYLKKHHDGKNKTNLLYKLSALKTKAISFEIEKIVGTVYFIISILTFLFAIILSDQFFKRMELKDLGGDALIEEPFLRIIYILLGIIVLILLYKRIKNFWKELDAKIDTATYHLTAINDDNATQPSVENMTRAVEQNDWELAGLWREKIQEEIQYKKGKRELIIKAADSVFSPLHFEGSEFQKYLERRIGDPFKEFKPDKWIKIKQNSLQSIVEDTNLRRRIEVFYNTMNDYNDLVPNLFLEMNKILNESFSKAFDKNIEGVGFYLAPPNSGNNVHLQTCVLFEIPPLKFVQPPQQFDHFELQIKKPDGTTERSSRTELNEFDNAWKQVLENVKSNEIMIKLKKCLTELKIENDKLMKIYSEKIGMQWNV